MGGSQLSRHIHGCPAASTAMDNSKKRWLSDDFRLLLLIMMPKMLEGFMISIDQHRLGQVCSTGSLIQLASPASSF